MLSLKSKARTPSPWLILAVAGGVIYPLVVYATLGHVSPMAPILFGVVLMGLRLIAFRKQKNVTVWRSTFAIAACLLVLLLILDENLAMKAYPVLVSLAVAAVFGISLVYPPNMIERFARVWEPDLPPEGVYYTRCVTWVWVIFLFLNALISAATAIWAPLSIWTLWNGLLSYLAMGTIFGIEFLVRIWVKRKRYVSQQNETVP